MRFISVVFVFVACVALCKGLPTNEIREKKLAKSLKVHPSLDIINGTRVRIQDYPFTVSVLLTGCLWGSGVVINNSWVVTSADLVYDTASEDFNIRSGSEKWSLGGQVIQAKDIIVHENYTGNGADYNIALIKLKRNIRFGKKLQPATLGSEPLKEGSAITVVGWGETDTNSKGYPASEFLLAANLTTMSQKKCQSALKTKIKAAFCTPAYDSVKPCDFDSGDPVVVDGKVYGFYTSAFACSPTTPSVYTDITQFLPWIQSQAESVMKQVREFNDNLTSINERHKEAWKRQVNTTILEAKPFMDHGGPHFINFYSDRHTLEQAFGMNNVSSRVMECQRQNTIDIWEDFVWFYDTAAAVKEEDESSDEI